ncbi:signal peptidase I [Ktedonospora formicarum]|uniref:Signal peptidase I n=1 Tax=Ktedonospora formicarum TaxID=2778364 RepID=A0A8J3MRH2_9CHLR|nr:signal peptidase I [Ktedonospora formicarum]GHO43781.1 signal peptidase I [Ktedonospora formicarum]
MKHPQYVREFVEIAVFAAVLFFAFRMVLQSYQVTSTSMSPALVQSSLVLVNKLAYTTRDPQRGDIVIFHYPRDTRVAYMQRIIGLPGDTIFIDEKHIRVNGHELHEPYASMTPINPFAKTWQVPDHQYFVLGDNRDTSEDSRIWDFVPRDYIIGKVAFVYWPLDRLQSISSYSDAYK